MKTPTSYKDNKNKIICVLCTYMNDVDRNKCVMCDSILV